MHLEQDFTVRLPREIVMHLRVERGEALEYSLGKDGSVVLYRKKKACVHAGV